MDTLLFAELTDNLTEVLLGLEKAKMILGHIRCD